MTPVGPRCPEHAYVQAAPRSVRMRMRMPTRSRGVPVVTYGLIGLNVLVYLITVAQGTGINNPGGKLFAQWWLDAPQVAHGGWWRLITAAFLHGSILHIGFNMFVLYVVGSGVEAYLGPFRYLAVYLVSGLAGSAGALIATPNGVTVGASGAIFGIFGALLIIEYQQTGSLAGQAMTLIAINLVISFSVPNISYGGHIGGLIGGILATLALSRFGRGHVAYGRPGLVGVTGVVVVAAASVAVAYWRVRGYA